MLIPVISKYRFFNSLTCRSKCYFTKAAQSRGSGPACFTCKPQCWGGSHLSLPSVYFPTFPSPQFREVKLVCPSQCIAINNY